MFSTATSWLMRICDVTALGTVVLVILVGCTGESREPPDLLKTPGSDVRSHQPAPEVVCNEQPKDELHASAEGALEPEFAPASPSTESLADVREPDDLHANVELAWTVPNGRGGAVLPRQRDQTWSSRLEKSFNRVLGITISGADQEIIFLGTHEPGWPALSGEDLVDGLAIAFQSLNLGEAPGVTFEATEEQLRREQREDDLLRVDYFGTARNTIVGWAAYEADRTMKCLAAGRDNITKQPMTAQVPGFLTELERILKSPGTHKASWHRFWIETVGAKVRRSDDGQTLLADVSLGIETRYQAISGGQLVDADRKAEPSARGFAAHLTTHYSQYAREFPSLAFIHNFAVLTSLAEAFLEASTVPQAPPSKLERWLESHHSRFIESPDVTPITVATAERQSKKVIHKARVAGGVTLRPRNSYDSTGSGVDQLATQTLHRRPTDSRQLDWTFNEGSVEFIATALTPRPHRQIWQEDLRSGPLVAVRELIPTESPGDAAEVWQLRIPQVQIDREAIITSTGKQVSRSAAVQSWSGSWRQLVPGEVELPIMSGRTPGFSSRDGSHVLALGSNGWLHVEQPVKFLSVNGGPTRAIPEGSGRVVEFSEEYPHQVRKVLFSEGQIEYLWAGSRLSQIRSGSFELKIDHDSNGRLDRIRNERGETVTYHYGRDSELRMVLHEGRLACAYHYDAIHRLTDISLGPGSHLETAGKSLIQLKLSPWSQATERRRSEIRKTTPGVVELQVVRGENGLCKLLINGGEVLFEGNFEPIWKGESTLLQQRERQLQQICQRPELESAKTVLIHGELTECRFLALALREHLPGHVVTLTRDARQATANITAPPLEAEKPQLVVIDTLKERYREDVEALRSQTAENGPVVILVAHNDTKGSASVLTNRIHSMSTAGEFEGKFVFLNVCGGGSVDKLIDDVIARGKARGVISFSQSIQQSLLAPVVEEILKRQREQPAPLDHHRFYELIDKAIDDVRQRFGSQSQSPKGPKGLDPDHIDNLRHWHHQTNRDVVPCEQGISTATAGVGLQTSTRLAARRPTTGLSPCSARKTFDPTFDRT